jgi:hypothetical protein
MGCRQRPRAICNGFWRVVTVAGGLQPLRSGCNGNDAFVSVAEAPETFRSHGSAGLRPGARSAFPTVF